jgi:hypothetical protein
MDQRYVPEDLSEEARASSATTALVRLLAHGLMAVSGPHKFHLDGLMQAYAPPDPNQVERVDGNRSWRAPLDLIRELSDWQD